jgi:hypothetical protein
MSLSMWDYISISFVTKRGPLSKEFYSSLFINIGLRFLCEMPKAITLMQLTGVPLASLAWNKFLEDGIIVTHDEVNDTLYFGGMFFCCSSSLIHLRIIFVLS